MSTLGLQNYIQYNNRGKGTIIVTFVCVVLIGIYKIKHKLVNKAPKC